MTGHIYCEKCGAIFAEPVGPCAHRGGNVLMYLPATGSEIVTEVTPPALHGEGTTASGGQIVTYRSSSGAQANSAIEGDALTLEVSGRIEVGDRGEADVISILRSTLSANGKQVSPGSDAENRDDDARLLIDGAEGHVQVITIPADKQHWASIARGSANTSVTLDQAAEWIHAAIASKAAKYGLDLKKNLILALDSRFVPVLPSPAIVDRYLASHGDPIVNHGFAAVWIVGPRESRCTQLGHGRW